MTPGPARSALRAARSYLTRMAPAHLGSYPLAVGAAWSAGHDVAATHVLTSLGPLAPSVTALGVAAVTFGFANTLAHRWALSSAIFTLAADAEWVGWTVDRMLERATSDDRRGTRAARAVATMLAGESVGSRAARWVLDRVGASAVHRAASVLASVEPSTEPIGTRVRGELEATMAREAGRRGMALAVLSGGVVAAAAASAAWVR